MWRDSGYLLHILIAARKVRIWTADQTWEEFSENEVVQSAALHQIGVIGEAARKLSPEIRAAHPELPWSQIVGMRNTVVHEYFRIELTKVWSIIQTDIPVLIAVVEPLVPPEEAE